MGLKIYVKASSAPCRSVYMVVEALKLKNVDFIEVNLPMGEHRTEEYLKMNPQHTVPTLKDGDLTVWDSHAIATYLVSQYGEDDSLYPKDPKKRAIVDQRLHFNNAILFNALRETVIPILYLNEKSYRPESVAKIKNGYEFIEAFFKGPWLAGDNITVADICTSSIISCLNVILPIDQKMYPNISSWLDRISKEEFYIKGCLPGLKSFIELQKSFGVQLE